jgi:hypothetical protein
MSAPLLQLVSRISAYAKSQQGNTLSDAVGVYKVINLAATLAGERNLFAKVIGNTLCNLNNWPPELKFLNKGICAGNPGQYFVPFANSGFCRRLRDDPHSDEGNLPHHMLSYFVMAHFLPAAEVYVGVQMHEEDTLATGSNPSMAGDLASGVLGVKLANLTYNLASFPETFARYTQLKKCGHKECQ